MSFKAPFQYEICDTIENWTSNRRSNMPHTKFVQIDWSAKQAFSSMLGSSHTHTHANFLFASIFQFDFTVNIIVDIYHLSVGQWSLPNSFFFLLFLSLSLIPSLRLRIVFHESNSNFGRYLSLLFSSINEQTKPVS